MKSNWPSEMMLWWPLTKQTEQAKFNVVLTTDNLFLYEIMNGFGLTGHLQLIQPV